MGERPVFWPSAASAVLGAWVGVGSWAALGYAFGVFGCGRHVGAVVDIPLSISFIFAIIAVAAATHRTGGSIVLALILLAPLCLLGILLVIVMMASRLGVDCGRYTIGLGF